MRFAALLLVAALVAAGCGRKGEPRTPPPSDRAPIGEAADETEG
ncbi:MAG: hypothetical protein AAF322_21555 [Pseudomonadota bacterium]